MNLRKHLMRHTFIRALGLFGLVAIASSGQKLIAIDLPQFILPVIPDRVFKVLEFGAVADGKTLNTEAFTKAITACKVAGGGTVVIPAGEYLSGPIEFVDHMELRLEKDAVLRFSDDPALYNAGNEKRLSAEEDPAEILRIKTPILGVNLTDVAITGEGTIDGMGKAWWVRGVTKFHDNGKPAEEPLPRPHLVQFYQCKNVLIEGITLTNSPQFHVVPNQCENVTCRDLKIIAPALSPNTDGIDPSNSKNVIITRCLIDTGDDNVSFKSFRGKDKKLIRPTENIYVTDCTFLHGHGVSVGSRTWSGVKNIFVDNCTFNGTDNGIRIKSARDRGGLVENIRYSNIKMKNMGNAITINMFYYDKSTGIKPITSETPIVRNVRISNVTVESAKNAGDIIGLPEMPVTDVIYSNVHVTADNGLKIKDVKASAFKDVTVTAKKGGGIVAENAEIDGMNAGK